MRLTRFEVTHFKNFRQTVVLDALDGFDVIHGENNVGKSNLLQAIDLFFLLVGSLGKRAEKLSEAPGEDEANAAPLIEDERQVGVRLHVQHHLLTQRGFSPDAIFNFSEPLPIELVGEIEVSETDFQRAGLKQPSQLNLFFLRFRVMRSHNGCVDVEVRTRRDEFNQETWAGLRIVAFLLGVNFTVQTNARAHGFILVDVFRRVPWVDGNEDIASLRRTVTDDLLLALYDAKESVEPGVFHRWELFERAMNSLGPVVGDGRFVITYNRQMRRAILAVQRGSLRIPIETMGSGVQQIAALVARVLLAGAAVVAVEEPELNLRYDMQLRLRDMLRDIVASGAGPQQILVTSHSPAFEAGAHFYGMRLTDEGPVVERRPTAESAAWLQLGPVSPPMKGGAWGYVSSDGLLRLPDEIRAELGVTQGGGVVVVKREEQPYVEVLSNEQFLGLIHGEQGEG
ncbi:MAG: AAA family ATPase [Polyangiales bacterium]